MKPIGTIYITPNGEREIDDWKVTLPVGRNFLYAAPRPDMRPTKEFDDCKKSPTGKHSASWYCNGDCEHCNSGSAVEPLFADEFP